MSVPASAPLSPEDKIELLLQTLDSIRDTLDETISSIDDSVTEIEGLE